METNCDTVKSMEDSANFFQAHSDETLGKTSTFPLSSNYASHSEFNPKGCSKSIDRNDNFN